MARRSAAVAQLAPMLLVALVAAGSTSATADTATFGRLVGNWRGNGEIRLEGGKSEQMRCTAYYTQRDRKTDELGLAIRCAAASYTIELRSQLILSGSQISGTWEERQFNAAGNVTGKVASDTITLSIVGGGFTGAMQVATIGTSQTVSISTEGNALKGVSIKLNKGT